MSVISNRENFIWLISQLYLKLISWDVSLSRESLYEDETFHQRQLAALVASKVGTKLLHNGNHKFTDMLVLENISFIYPWFRSFTTLESQMILFYMRCGLRAYLMFLRIQNMPTLFLVDFVCNSQFCSIVHWNIYLTYCFCIFYPS